jgi:2-oxoglutarate ferredoxin oxidoreductase subunit gamma
VLNRPSMDKFEPMIKPGGLLIVNSSLVDRKAVRTDIRVIYVDANRLAEEKLGSAKVANMLVLGAYIAATGVVTAEGVKRTMDKKMKDKARFIPMNKAAIDLGIETARAQLDA